METSRSWEGRVVSESFRSLASPKRCLVCDSESAPRVVRMPIATTVKTAQLNDYPVLRLCATCWKLHRRVLQAARIRKWLIAILPPAAMSLLLLAIPLPTPVHMVIAYVLVVVATVFLERRLRRVEARRTPAILVGGWDDQLTIRVVPPHPAAPVPGEGPYRTAADSGRAPLESLLLSNPHGFFARLVWLAAVLPVGQFWSWSNPHVIVDNPSGDEVIFSVDGGERQVLASGRRVHRRWIHGRHEVRVHSPRRLAGLFEIDLPLKRNHLFALQAPTCYRDYKHFGPSWIWVTSRGSSDAQSAPAQTRHVRGRWVPIIDPGDRITRESCD